VLIIPPTINRFYVIDLAPGRSLAEYLVASGFTVFMMSWRNPDSRLASWDFGTYGQAVLDAVDAVTRITGGEQLPGRRDHRPQLPVAELLPLHQPGCAGTSVRAVHQWAHRRDGVAQLTPRVAPGTYTFPATRAASPGVPGGNSIVVDLHHRCGRNVTSRNRDSLVTPGGPSLPAGARRPCNRLPPSGDRPPRPADLTVRFCDRNSWQRGERSSSRKEAAERGGDGGGSFFGKEVPAVDRFAGDIGGQIAPQRERAAIVVIPARQRSGGVLLCLGKVRRAAPGAARAARWRAARLLG
jgi:hypothetical protein